MRVYVCIQNSGSLKVKETELVETEKKKKNTSRPNGLWTKHIQTRKIYECRSLHISCLFKNTATRRTGHGARIAVRICVCPTRKKKERGEILRRLSTISKHTNNLRQEWYCSNSCFGKHPAVEGGGKWKKKNLIKFISGSLASQLVSWTAAVVKSPRWPRQARSRINKKYLIKALPRNTILLKLRPYYQKKTNRDWSKVIKIKRGESMGLESSTKRPTLKRRWRNIRPKQSWHWLFAAVKT